MIETNTIEIVALCHLFDEPHLEHLVRHLSPILGNKGASLWHRGMLAAGDEITAVIGHRIENAAIILLLLSADFLNAYSAKLTDILKQARYQKSRVVPIVLRPCPWDALPFERFHSIPANRVPLVRDGVPNEQDFCSAAKEIGALVDDIRTKSSPARAATMSSLEHTPEVDLSSLQLLSLIEYQQYVLSKQLKSSQEQPTSVRRHWSQQEIEAEYAKQFARLQHSLGMEIDATDREHLVRTLHLAASRIERPPAQRLEQQEIMDLVRDAIIERAGWLNDRWLTAFAGIFLGLFLGLFITIFLLRLR